MNRLIFVSIIILMAFSGCLFQGDNKTSGQNTIQPGEDHGTELFPEFLTIKEINDGRSAFAGVPLEVKGTVTETRLSGGYLYANLDDGTGDIWIATTPVELAEGEEVIATNAILMENFPAKSLNMTFDIILFTDTLMGKQVTGQNTNTQVVPSDFDFSTVSKAEGGQTIEELYQQKAELSGQEIKVNGIVVKISPDIMEHTWIHVQDGSGDPGQKNHDLTITVHDYSYEVGDNVQVSGILTADKDFGSGYLYSIIIEEGIITALN